MFPEPIVFLTNEQQLLDIKYRPGISGVLVYGTDGETNLTNALGEVLDVANHLRCDIHLRDNIKNKMRDLGLDKYAASEILADIFGKNVGDQREGGLIDCTSSNDFDTACANVIKKWTNTHERGEEFVDYFLKEKAEVLRESCRADIRSMCGLGFPPKVYTQNANECMNRLIKNVKTAKYGNQSTSLIDYIDIIEQEAQRRHEEQFLAVIGRGQYHLTEEFKFLQVNKSDFYRMIKSQKEEFKKNSLLKPCRQKHKRWVATSVCQFRP
jgi:transposase-like protein